LTSPDAIIDMIFDQYNLPDDEVDDYLGELIADDDSPPYDDWDGDCYDSFLA
jgi:hypothetical protein